MAKTVPLYIKTKVLKNQAFISGEATAVHSYACVGNRQPLNKKGNNHTAKTQHFQSTKTPKEGTHQRP
ncbi:hypothetical protein [Anaeromassilibacillus sp. SJQ-1]|uniref:hypothetical protein n=1 Tax=Anaeromassilibacillus sp. SJQ-1 TaxID=3375419 RepID=UPI0039897A1D